MSSCRLWAVAVVGTAGYMNRCNSGSRSRCNSGCRNRYKQWAAGIGAVVGCSCRNMCREKSQVMGEGFLKNLERDSEKREHLQAQKSNGDSS